MKNLKELVTIHNDRHRTYCPVCGGSGKQRVALTGNTDLDYRKCTRCNGHGQPQVLRSTAAEIATQPWRKEF
jgi:DnaJ-class molecular chaperone